MGNTRARLGRVERIVNQRDKGPDMVIAMVAPDDYPDPLPPGYSRQGDLDKKDLSAYSYVLRICIPPADYEERKRAAEAAKVRPGSTQTLPRQKSVRSKMTSVKSKIKCRIKTL